MSSVLTEPVPLAPTTGQDMATNESEGTGRTRMIIDTEEIIRRAVARRTLKEGLRCRREVSKSEVVTEILREALAEEIAELLQQPTGEGSSGKKRGRKRKQERGEE